MSKITIWDNNTVPAVLLESMLTFYKNQIPYDKNFGGADLRGVPPQREDIPELYDFLESCGYKIKNYPATGNYLETSSVYPIHADTGKDTTFNTNYTVFLFPLYLPADCNSYLFFLNQFWAGEATTFIKDPWPKGWNNMVADYNHPDLLGVDYDKWDNRINNLGIKFTHDTLNGMTVSSIYKWSVGSFASFPCSQLHFSTTDKSEKKLGLSLRLLCE